MNFFRFLAAFWLLFEPCLVSGATDYYSRQNGNYAAPGTWSNTGHAGSASATAPCSCTPCNVTGSRLIEIAHDVVIGCDLGYSGNPTVSILGGGSLTTTGNASVSGAVIFEIDSGAVVNITGNLNVIGGGGYINVNGTLNIGGNFTINGSYPVCGNGTIVIGGTLDGTICGTVTVLPVTWLGVSARLIGERVRVDWATASEINNDYFTLEKSSDGVAFFPAATVNGAGTTTVYNEYTVWDDRPYAGLNAYRIRQTDYNGDFTLSETVVVFVAGDEVLFEVMPSPGLGLVLHVAGMEGEAVVSAYDLQGRLLNRSRFVIGRGSVTKAMAFEGPVDGICLVHLSAGMLNEVRKVFLRR